MTWWERLLRKLLGEGEVAPSPEPAMPSSSIPPDKLHKLPKIYQDGKAEQEERKLWLDYVTG